MLTNILWVIFWFVTLFATMFSMSVVIQDRGTETTAELVWFLATPLLWAIALVFFF